MVISLRHRSWHLHFTASNFQLHNTNILWAPLWEQHPKGQAHHKKLPLHKAFCIPSQRSGLQDLVFRAVLTLLFFFLDILLYSSCLMDNSKLIYSFFSEVDPHRKTLEQGHFAFLQSPARLSVKALSKILPCQTKHFYWLDLILNADLGSSLNPNGSAAINHTTTELSLATLGFQAATLHWKFLHSITTYQRPPIS